MHRIATQTALASILALGFVPAAAQTEDVNCLPLNFESDANADGMISAEEAKAAADREFARFDVNKDENISRDEFAGCYGATGPKDRQASAGGGQQGAGGATGEETTAAANAGQQDASGGGAGQSAQAGTGQQTGSQDQGAGQQRTASGDDTDISGEEDITRTEENFARADIDGDGAVDRSEFGLGAQRAFDEAQALAEQGGTGAGEETEQAATGQEEVVTEQDVPGANMAEGVLTDEAEGTAAAGDSAEGVDIPSEGGPEIVQMPEPGEQDVGEPGQRAPEIVEERFLESPYADFRTMQDRALTEEEIAFNSAQLFAALDADRDDTLDASEWMRVAPLAERGPATLGQVFERIDADGDGRIGTSEYVAAVLSAHAEAAEAAGAQADRTAEGQQQGVSEQAAQARTGVEADAEGRMDEESATAPSATDETTAGVPVFLYRIYRF